MKNRIYLVLIIAAVSCLCAVLSGSIFLLAKMDSDNRSVDALRQWEKKDPFVPPEDGRVSHDRFDRFLKVNYDLSGVLQKVREKFEANKWRIGFELIKMHPEWTQQKFKALQRHGMSPREYDWIAGLVIRFWIDNWQNESLPLLDNFVWQSEEIKKEPAVNPNDQIFKTHEAELNHLFDILWPERKKAPVDE